MSTVRNTNFLPTDMLGELQKLFDIDAAAPAVDPKVYRFAEHRLMIDVLVQAITDAMESGAHKTHIRQAARDWLRGAPGFTAREACEALGIDYDAALQRLELKWSQFPRGKPQDDHRGSKTGAEASRVIGQRNGNGSRP